MNYNIHKLTGEWLSSRLGESHLDALNGLLKADNHDVSAFTGNPRKRLLKDGDTIVVTPADGTTSGHQLVKAYTISDPRRINPPFVATEVTK